ncbi:MAG TPA: hypothetical protein PLI53_10430 [Geobacteraceae bacterium]|nr:hypothetical protein [Geobacteraceae bacterium]
MIDTSSFKGLWYGPAVYCIRVAGRLDPAWSERLEGMSISITEQKGRGTISELSGQLPDQAALMGVLQELYTCGITLLGVECKPDNIGDGNP